MIIFKQFNQKLDISGSYKLGQYTYEKMFEANLFNFCNL